IAYWRAVPGIRSRRNLDYILARAECDFRSPTTLEDDLCCHVRVGWFGRSSFAFEYLLRDERSGRNVAEGRTVQVMFDYAVRRSRPLDTDLKAAIERFEGRSVPSRSRAAARPRGDRGRCAWPREAWRCSWRTTTRTWRSGCLCTGC